MPMYDINCHLLPGIDGGPATMEEGVQMVLESARSGVAGIAITPDQRDVHEYLGIDQLDRQMSLLRRAVRANESRSDLRVRLRLGMENHLSRDLANLYDVGEALPIEETRFLLIRLPFNYLPDYTESVIDQLRVWRLQPILAHPERNVVLQRDWKRLRDMIGVFGFVQISAGSILGNYGTDARNAAEQFIARGIAHVVASEMRKSSGTLGPSLAEAYDAVRDIVGNRGASLLFEANPNRVLSGISPRVLTMEQSDRSIVRRLISPLART